VGEFNMKAFTGVFLVLLGALPALAQPPAAEKGKAKVPDYYPLKVGSKWHYQLAAANGKQVQIVNQIAKLETIDGKTMARLEAIIGGNVAGTEHLSSNDQGIFRNRYNGVEVSPPVCLLKYPITEGASWETVAKIGDQQLTFTGREGPKESVQVPAGTYQTVTAIVQTTVNGMKISTTYWFAANVGVVKQTMDLNGQTVNMELVKYEEGK
jgi:hypothetical protein